MAIGREKGLKLINTPSHSSNDGQASPCLNSHSTHIPIFIACSILCLVLPHHCPIHAPQSIDSDLLFCSCKAGYMLFLELLDIVLMKSTKIHSPLQTLNHNLTPHSLHVIIYIIYMYNNIYIYNIYILIYTPIQEILIRSDRY